MLPNPSDVVAHRGNHDRPGLLLRITSYNVCYTKLLRIGCEEAVKLILGAGGVPVLAHPALLNINDDSQLDGLIQNLIKIGMRGIEVYYPEHSPEQTLRYSELV